MLRRLEINSSILLALGLAASVLTGGCATEDDVLGLEPTTDEGSDLAAEAAEAEAPASELLDELEPFDAYELAPDGEDFLSPSSEEHDFHAETLGDVSAHMAPAPGSEDAPADLERTLPPVAGAASCLASDLKLTVWPLTGSNGKHWLVNNYVDLDSTAGKRDYTGATGSLARTYDGHRGMDVDTSSFREMDANTMLVRAAAPGVVEALDESNFDRNTTCVGSWNYVKIRQANGYAIFYGHLKKNSVVVNVGDSVVAGQKLGIAGSSGCSSQPHLHLEVHNCSDTAVEPNNFAMWTAPPAYSAPSDIMDVMLRKSAFSSAGQIKDPVANPTLYKPGDSLGIGLSMAGKGGDSVTLQLIAPNAAVDAWSWTVPGVARYTHLYPYWNKTAGATVGTWTLRVFVNGSLKTTRTFGVSNYAPGFAEVAKHGVGSGSYQTVFTDVTTAGYRPIWVDGFNVGGSTFYNAIFRPTGGKPWVARHGLDGTQYQTEFDTWTDAGYRVTHVDSYLSGGAVRYAVVFTKEAGPAQTAYHGVSEASHQASFDTLKNQGWRPVNVSVVDVGGSRRITALYDKAAVGSFAAFHGIPAAQYQGTFDAQKNAGRFLKYLDAYTLGGQVFYSGVWDSVAWGPWAARHDRTSAQYQAEYDNWTGQGYLTRFVTGVSAGGTAKYAAIWSK